MSAGFNMGLNLAIAVFPWVPLSQNAPEHKYQYSAPTSADG